MNMKEYELIAASIRRWYGLMNVQYLTLWELVDDMANSFEVAYPKTFDRDKFLKACGIEQQ